LPWYAKHQQIKRQQNNSIGKIKKYQCKYFKHGWFGVINPSPDTCKHIKHKKRHNKRIQSKYYNSVPCMDFVMMQFD
jgi:hypothetical protein